MANTRCDIVNEGTAGNCTPVSPRQRLSDTLCHDIMAEAVHIISVRSPCELGMGMSMGAGMGMRVGPRMEMRVGPRMGMRVGARSGNGNRNENMGMRMGMEMEMEPVYFGVSRME